MKWKDSDDSGQPDLEPVEDYVDEETYSPWRKKSSDSWFSMGGGRSVLLYILAAVGVLILVFTVGNIFSNTDGRSYDKEFEALDKRIGQLEAKLDKLEETYATVAQIDVLDKKNEQLKGRFDRMAAALSLRMDLISKKVATSKGNTAAVPKKKKTVRKAPVKKSVEKTPVRYHDVKTGETLFSISRKYDLTIDELMKMNKLAKDQKIQAGQKLIVGPSTKQ